MNNDKDTIIDDDYMINGDLNVDLERESRPDMEDEDQNEGKQKCGHRLKRLTVEPLILLYGIGLYALGPVTRQVYTCQNIVARQVFRVTQRCR